MTFKSIRLAKALLPAVFLVLSACASSFQADVTRFHKMTATGGKSATIVAADPKLEGLQFTSYAGIIGRQMERFGYTAAGQADPDIRVIMNYGLLETGESRSNTSVGVGVGSYGRHGGASVFSSFPVGGSKTWYSYRLDLVFEDAATGERLFEGYSVTVARESDLGLVMPYLAAALFEGFPGVSGQTVQVELPLDLQ